jgi:hypothetical protein
MIASVFGKTRPFNYLTIGILLFVFFITKNIIASETNVSLGYYLQEFLLFVVVFASSFLINFIALKNELTKTNNYALLLYFVFLLFFSSYFQNKNIIIANFFLLLALRRLISLKTMVSTKEKIFDASFWILIAALFHFWSLFYIVLVFIAIMLHVSRDYRNWVVPFIALVAVTLLFFLVNSFFDNSLLSSLLSKTYISFDFYYFENIYQRLAFALFTSLSLFAFVLQIFDIPNKALNMQSSHKTILFSFLLGIGIYIISANKNNGSLAFCFGPLAIIGANFLEKMESKWLKEIMVYALVGCAVFFYVLQL